MRDDIRKLQTVVYNYMKENKLTQEKMAERGAPELTRGKLGYLLNGNATAIDTALLAGYAKAMRVPFSTLAARIGVTTATPATSREGRLLAEFQSVAELLDGVQKDMFLDTIERAIDQAKATLRAS